MSSPQRGTLRSLAAKWLIRGETFVDATQFDRWTRRFGAQRSRRAVIAGLVGLALAAVPRASGAQPGTPVPIDSDDDPLETPDDVGQATAQVSASQGVCADFVWCKTSQTDMRDGAVTTLPVGRIPGGPYETQWCWDCYRLGDNGPGLPGCVPVSHDRRELEALCNSAYPDLCDNDCCAGALFDVYC